MRTKRSLRSGTRWLHRAGAPQGIGQAVAIGFDQFHAQACAGGVGVVFRLAGSLDAGAGLHLARQLDGDYGGFAGYAEAELQVQQVGAGLRGPVAAAVAVLAVALQQTTGGSVRYSS